jgi:hypothetical protein
MSFTPWIIDVKKKSWRVSKRNWCTSIGPDSLFEITTDHYPEKRAVQLEMLVKVTLLNRGFEIIKF